MLMASSADRVERQAVQQRQVFDTLSDEVENDAWALSDLARLYVIKPSPETLTQYQQLQQTDKSIEQRLGGLKDNGASREELALLQDGLRIANELQDEQQAALAHVARGDAPAAIAVFIGAYCESLFGIGGWMVYLAFYIVFIGIHIFGVGEALKLMFIITAVAALALAVFIVAMVPHFSVDKLLDIAPTTAAGASNFLPYGYVGIWAAIPYAIWFFLAVEGVPLAAEETKNPQRDMPRGLIGAMLILVAFAGLILLVGPGGAGSSTLVASGNPLVEALTTAYGSSTWMSGFVNLVGLAGLIASFFSIIFAYSRQIFALSRAGYLPRNLSLTNKNKAPVLALVIPGVIGFLLSLTGQGDLLILVAVFGATISYVLMMASHIVLRLRRPDLHRPYRTPGGIVTSGVALVLACIAVIAGFLVDPRVVIGAAIIYGIFIAYFAIYSRHHLVAGTPEEEFAAIEQAEATLK